MIELIPYTNFQDKMTYLEGLQAQDTTTLIISDLSSKLIWQDFYLNRDSKLEGNFILRAEDLWKSLLQISFPEIKFVNQAWMMTYVKEFLKTGIGNNFGLPNAKPSSLLKALNELLPILCHNESETVMNEWFQETKQGKCSWEPWYHLSLKLWSEITTKNILLEKWAAGYLLQNNRFDQIRLNSFIVDLGPEIRTIESELFKQIGANTTVQILVPQQDWITQYRWISFPYNQLSTLNSKKTLPSENLFEPSKKEFLRFTAPLGEVKFAVAKLRSWIKQGFAANQLAIFAPDIEEYWPLLRWHLKKEGIPANKATGTRVTNLGSVIAWLSFLKKKCGEAIKESELAIAEFHPANYQNSPYSEFVSKYSHRGVIKYSSDLDSSARWVAVDFIKWAFDTWPQKSLLETKVIELCKLWLIEAESLEGLSLRAWIDYLENFLGQKEIIVEEADPNGVGFFTIMSGLPSHRKLQIFLGCSESQLKSPTGLISGADVLSLQNQTGHLLAHPDRDFKEYQLNALLNFGIHQVFTFAQTDFQGTELVPSIFWLNGRATLTTEFHSLAEWDQTAWEYQLSTEVLDEEQTTNLNLENWDFSLSPATLKSYIDCPFKFFAEKGLKLVDPAIVDLDLDLRTQGSIHHRLLELICEEPFDKQTLLNKLPETIEVILKEHESVFYSDQTKNLCRLQLRTLATRFLDHEESYRKEYPNFRTLAKEAWFRREVKTNTKAVLFRGKLDRVDISTISNDAIVIDYKSTLNSYHNAEKWLTNNEFQLAAYTESIEGGNAKLDNKQEIPPTTVIAAHYYGLQDFARKGFTLENSPAGVVHCPSNNSKLSPEGKKAIIDEFNVLLKQTAEKIIAGDFRPTPHPKTDCKKCAWSNICRAPQQNL